MLGNNVYSLNSWRSKDLHWFTVISRTDEPVFTTSAKRTSSRTDVPTLGQRRHTSLAQLPWGREGSLGDISGTTVHPQESSTEGPEGPVVLTESPTRPTEHVGLPPRTQGPWDREGVGLVEVGRVRTLPEGHTKVIFFPTPTTFTSL